MPRVTVCIPTYQRTRWLAETIESVLGQTFEDLVVEVHDDATPGDAVVEVVAGFDDPRLVLIRHEQNAGIIGNFTRSLLGADTEYVIQIGDDDIALPSLVEKTVAALDAAPRAGFAYGRISLIDADGATLVDEWVGPPSPALEPGHEFVEQTTMHGIRVCSSTAMIRRSAVPPGGFLQEDYPQFDLAFWMRMAENWDVAFVPEVLCEYRIHDSSHTSALSDLTPGGYLQVEQTLRDVYDVKRRHAAALPVGPRRTRLEQLADQAFRRGLVGRVREQTLPERKFLDTARRLGRSARREPSLLREPTAWALLAGSVVGSRAVDRLKGRA
jgi:glycosyltransferase involved in cell wall biosynthesis